MLQPGPFDEGNGLQSISEESSGNSFTSTFSPFHWGMPVSPSAFPVRQVPRSHDVCVASRARPAPRRDHQRLSGVARGHAHLVAVRAPAVHHQSTQLPLTCECMEYACSRVL